MWSEDTVASNAKFVYTLNRFNVSVTRAKRKCIVILLETLLKPSIALLEQADAARGFFYIQQFVSHSKTIRLDSESEMAHQLATSLTIT